MTHWKKRLEPFYKSLNFHFDETTSILFTLQNKLSNIDHLYSDSLGEAHRYL